MAIKYLRASGGLDTNDGLSFASGWASMNYAFSADNANRIAPGDTLAICGDLSGYAMKLSGSVSPACGTNPTAATPVYVYAYDESGVLRSDGSRTALTCTGTLTNGLFNFTDTTSLVWFRWSNLEFNGGGSGLANYCIQTTNSDDFEGMSFWNCRFTNASSHGITARSSNTVGAQWRFYNCEIDNNGKSGTGAGIDGLNPTRGSYFMYGCKVHHNAGVGVEYGGMGQFLRCMFYKNSSDGVSDTNNVGGTGAIFEGCVFYGNTGDGLDMNASTTFCNITNNIFSTNGGYGINVNSMDTDRIDQSLMTHNCSYANTAGHINVFTGVLPGTNVLADPLFTSTTDGSEDFTVQTGSPCIDNGLNPLGY